MAPRLAVRLGVKWSNLEQQAPDSIPPTGHMLKMALKLTTWVPIDHTQRTSMLSVSPDKPAAVGQVVQCPSHQVLVCENHKSLTLTSVAL